MNEKHQLLISQCRNITKKTLSALLQGFFDELDDALYEASDEVTDASLREDYLQAMRNTRKDRSAMEGVFKKTISEGFEQFVAGDDILTTSSLRTDEDEDDFDLDQLSLVDEDDMEESLAISNMTAKAESRFSEELSALNKRFAVILGLEQVKTEDNPLAPKAIGEAFVNAMHELNLEVTEDENNLIIRLVIYKRFDLHVFKYVGAFYDELNELLHNGGIEHKSPKKFRQNPVAPTMPQEAPQLTQNTQQPEEPDGFQPAPMYPQVGSYPQNFPPPPSYQELTGLVRQQYVQSVEGLVDPALPVVPPQQLAGMFSGMQNQALMAGGAISDLNSSIYNALRKGDNPQSVRQEDQDAINVISMLFDFVLDDTNLPDNMRVLLSKLQIPLLKVAVIDKSFFSNKNHAARSLLNNLAQASVGLTGDSPLHKPLIKRIETIINRIIDEFKENVSLFTLLDEEFTEFLEKENKRAFIAEKRTAQVNQGQEQRKIAKAKVAEAINSRVHGHRLPKVVKKLLVDPWNTLLNLAYLKNGEEDENWISGLKIIDTLMWTLSGSSDPVERKKIIKTIPALLIKIRDHLKSISYNSQEMILLLKGLQEAHVISLRQSSPDKKERESQVEETKKLSPELQEAVTVEEVDNIVESPIDLEQKERTAEEEEDEAFQKANNLEIGAWVEWVNDKEEHVRGKLSWKSDVTGILVFVNRKGMKIAEMDVDELAELLRKETTKDLKDTNLPLMDRALSAMVEVLKKSETIATESE